MRLRLHADGSFASEFIPVKFEGTWYVRDGVLVETVTNVIPGILTNRTTMESVGSIDRCKILSTDTSHLTLSIEVESNYFVTNTFTKEP